jgi:hypothetical protein
VSVVLINFLSSLKQVELWAVVYFPFKLIN